MSPGRLLSLLGAALLCGACHYLRAPRREAPELSAGVHARVQRMGELERSYLVYLPTRRVAKPALLVVLHGARQSAEDLRRATGYEFDRLADQHGFVALYPEAHGGRWNDCRARGRYAARRLELDDVGFVLTLIDGLRERAGIDPERVFLAGYSNGAHLSFRIALEHPERIAAIAAFAANLPTEENWFCRSAGKPVSALLINGTSDRINPFEGGKVAVYGFAQRGTVRSAEASAEYFAKLAGLSSVRHDRFAAAPDAWIERWHWQEHGAHEVMLLAVEDGGHVVPGPTAAFPRILGQVSHALDGPREAWSFFSRHSSQSR